MPYRDAAGTVFEANKWDEYDERLSEKVAANSIGETDRFRDARVGQLYYTYRMYVAISKGTGEMFEETFPVLNRSFIGTTDARLDFEPVVERI